jgi:hypothetical protein
LFECLPWSTERPIAHPVDVYLPHVCFGTLTKIFTSGSTSADLTMASNPPAKKPEAPKAAAAAPAAMDTKPDKAKDDKAAEAKAGEKKEDGKDTTGSKREMKRAPNRLIVDESHGDGDNSVVMLSLKKMEGALATSPRCLSLTRCG